MLSCSTHGEGNSAPSFLENRLHYEMTGLNAQPGKAMGAPTNGANAFVSEVVTICPECLIPTWEFLHRDIPPTDKLQLCHKVPPDCEVCTLQRALLYKITNVADLMYTHMLEGLPSDGREWHLQVPHMQHCAKQQQM